MERPKDPTRRDIGRYRFGLDLATVALVVGATAAVASAGVGVASAASQASAQRSANAAAAEQARVTSEYNRRVAENQAAQARQAATVEEENYRRQVRAAQAANRAAIGASGVDMTGSPLLVLMDNASQAEMEAQRIRTAGLSQAAALESQADLESYYGAQAQNAAARQRQQIGQQETAAYIGAGTSLLSSAGQLGYSYYGLKQFGKRPNPDAALGYM